MVGLDREWYEDGFFLIFLWLLGFLFYGLMNGKRECMVDFLYFNVL